jgi:CBS domain-containing protein
MPLLGGITWEQIMGIVPSLKKVFPTVLTETTKQMMRSLVVQDIMSYPIKTIPVDDTMADAAKLMGRHHVGSLIVMDKDEPAGIVTERDLMSHVYAYAKEPDQVKVGAVMSKPLITIDHDSTLKEAAIRMIRKKGRLVVMKKGAMVGVVTASDLLKGLPETRETEVQPLEYGTEKVETADKNDSVAKVVKLMGIQRIGSVVVTSEGKPWGIFTERDLLTTMIAKGKPLSTPVGDVASTPLMVTDANVNVYEAANIMTHNRIKRLPLVDENDELHGIITARDLVEAFSK